MKIRISFVTNSSSTAYFISTEKGLAISDETKMKIGEFAIKACLGSVQELETVGEFDKFLEEEFYHNQREPDKDWYKFGVEELKKGRVVKCCNVPFDGGAIEELMRMYLEETGGVQFHQL